MQHYVSFTLPNTSAITVQVTAIAAFHSTQHTDQIDLDMDKSYTTLWITGISENFIVLGNYEDIKQRIEYANI